MEKFEALRKGDHVESWYKAYNESLAQIRERNEMTLKGQTVNSFETPQYVTAFLDRRVLFAKIDKLEQENKRLEKQVHLITLSKDKDKLEQEKRELVEALEFYADITTWRGIELGTQDFHTTRDEMLDGDGCSMNIGGVKARQVLAKIKSEGRGLCHLK